MTDDNELTPEELAAMPRVEREAYERKMAWEQRDREEAANEVVCYFTREQADAMLTALHIAEDEMPWSEFDGAWQDVAAIVQAAMREKGMFDGD